MRPSAWLFISMYSLYVTCSRPENSSSSGWIRALVDFTWLDPNTDWLTCFQCILWASLAIAQCYLAVQDERMEESGTYIGQWNLHDLILALSLWKTTGTSMVPDWWAKSRWTDQRLVFKVNYEFFAISLVISRFSFGQEWKKNNKKRNQRQFWHVLKSKIRETIKPQSIKEASMRLK